MLPGEDGTETKLGVSQSPGQVPCGGGGKLLNITSV